jgi:hypothetical protein
VTQSQAADTADLARRLKSVTDYVRDCERRVSQGEIMDLTGLDRNVLEICNGVAALPPPQGRLLQGELAALIGDLDKLAAAMKSRQPADGNG